MFGRRGGRQLRRGFGRRGAPPVLQHANQMMMDGDFAGAADSFKELAQGAENLFPQRAPILYLEAGRAAILGGDVKTGVAHLRRGLTLLASQGRFHRMRVLGQRAIEELRMRGLNAEAEEIESLLGANLPQELPAESKPIKRPVLPTHCPSCGGSIKPDEIEWLDEITAECDYCGSPLRGEE
jgi:hypothetical protein